MSKIKFILMDIEGTTSSLSFVHEELFPYAKRHLPGFLTKYAGSKQVQKCLMDIEYTKNDENLEGNATQVLLSFIEQDRKHPALKTLQGLIWEDGYLNGELKGHVYPDVKPAWEKWKAQGLRLGIYSSGSVWAQKLLFKYSVEGDLTEFLEAYFDTAIGFKKDLTSYIAIAQELNLSPEEIMFITDNPDEIVAAVDVGFNAVHSLRPGVKPFSFEPQVKDFSKIDVMNL